MDSVMPLFAILGLDYFKFDGLLSCFTSGDASVVSVDLPTLTLVAGEDRQQTALDITLAPAPSANRATQGDPDPQAGTRRKKCRQDYQAPKYPPSDAVQWNTITGIFKDKKSSPTATHVMTSTGQLDIQSWPC